MLGRLPPRRARPISCAYRSATSASTSRTSKSSSMRTSVWRRIARSSGSTAISTPSTSSPSVIAETLHSSNSRNETPRRSLPTIAEVSTSALNRRGDLPTVRFRCRGETLDSAAVGGRTSRSPKSVAPSVSSDASRVDLSGDPAVAHCSCHQGSTGLCHMTRAETRGIHSLCGRRRSDMSSTSTPVNRSSTATIRLRRNGPTMLDGSMRTSSMRTRTAP